MAGGRAIRQPAPPPLSAGDRSAITSRVKELCLETPGISVQLDGDYFRESPIRFSVDPGALLLSIPSAVRPALLSVSGDE